MPRTHAAVPIVRQKFGLIRGHIDIYRAIAFASFTGQAEIKRLFHTFVAPTICQEVAVEHLPEVMRASSRRVPLFVRHREAWAHRVVIGLLAAFPSAFADSNAAQCG